MGFGTNSVLPTTGTDNLFLLTKDEAPRPPRTPRPVLRGAKRAAARADKAWMEKFLAVAMDPAARAEREEIEFFGNRKRTKDYVDLSGLLLSASIISPSTYDAPSTYDGDPFNIRWKAQQRAELGDWLATVITENKAAKLEQLIKVLRSRKTPQKQTLKSCILRCLDRLIIESGCHCCDFSTAAICTSLSIERMNQKRGANRKEAEEELARWWSGKCPELLPKHLPTKHALRKATAATYQGKDLDEFKKACTALGLSELPSKTGNRKLR